MTGWMGVAAVAASVLLGTASGVASAQSTDPGSTPSAVTPTPSTGRDTSVTGSDTPSKPPQGATDSPSASPDVRSPRRDGSDPKVPSDQGGTGTMGTGTYGAPPYGLGSTPPGK